MGHGHSIEHRAPTWTESTRNQGPEVELKEGQVIFRRLCIALQGHRQLGQRQALLWPPTEGCAGPQDIPASQVLARRQAKSEQLRSKENKQRGTASPHHTHSH